MRKIIVLALGLLVSCVSVSMASTIYFKDGRTVDGDIIQKNAYYTIVNVNGTPNKYYNDQIESIVDSIEKEVDSVLVDYTNLDYIDSDKVDLIIRLIVISGIKNNLKHSIANVIKKAPLERREEMKELFDLNEIIEHVIPVYDNHYTVEEIQELLKFYESPIGKKFLETNPKIAVESADASIAYFQEQLSNKNIDK